MSKLLYIQASPRQERSHSRAVADAFVQAYRVAHPEDDVETVNLFEAELPAFEGLALEAKYKILHGQAHSDEEKRAWRRVEAVIEQFTSADKYVLAVPMWNFAIPYRLKQYIDILVQPTYTFAFSPDEGYKGLVTGKPALVVYASGGDYSEGSGQEAYDMQKPYVEAILRFIGFSTIRSLAVQPTLASDPQVAADSQQAAIARARVLATTF